MGVSTARPIRDANYYWREPSLEPPTWEGKGAAILGIRGQAVDQQTFLNLHDGYTTRDGERDQKLPRYIREGRRGSFDVTVNLPKCASIVEALGDSRIGDVLSASTDAVKRELERQAWTRNPWERGNGLVMTSFRHGGSREGDPHLHDHVWVANLSPSSKGWKAVEMGRNVDWGRIGDVAREEQVKGFRQLGYRVKRDGESYEIVGVPAEVKAKFSRRHEQVKRIEAEMERKKGSPLTSKARGKLSVYDRPDKPAASHDERRAGWLGQVTDSEHRIVAGIIRRAKATARHERYAELGREAFDRQRGYEVHHEPERSRGRSR